MAAGLPARTLSGPVLNPLLALGRGAWSALRTTLQTLLADGPPASAVPLAEDEMRLPLAVGDYVDFYSSLEHATNLGRLFRPDAEPLLPNWRHLPVAYHGRSTTVVVTGTPVLRPSGQPAAGGSSARVPARHRARARLRDRPRKRTRPRSPRGRGPRLRLRARQRLERP